MALKTRPFGTTGLQVSELVFGGGWVGGLLIDQDDATKLATVRRALEAGINWIDTAASYGQGESEKALGWILKETPSRPYLSTKFEIALDRLDDIAGQIERSLTASLERLQCESLQLLQLHNRIEATLGDRALTPHHILTTGGVADALERLREQGLFRHAGITALGDAASCREVIASGRFASAQVYYNMINPSAAKTAMPPGWNGHDFSGLIDCCRQHGVAVMNIRVFAAGILATDVRHGREIPVTRNAAVEDEQRRARAAFAVLGDDYGSRAQTAIRFALAQPDIACVVFGLAKPEHLEEALAAAERGPLPAEALARLDAATVS